MGPDVFSCDLLTKYVTRHNSATAPGPLKLPRFHSGSSRGALSSGVHTQGPIYLAAVACSDDNPHGRGSRAGAEPALPSLSSNPGTVAVDTLGGPQLRHPPRTAGRTPLLSLGWGQDQHRQWLGSECTLFVPAKRSGCQRCLSPTSCIQFQLPTRRSEWHLSHKGRWGTGRGWMRSSPTPQSSAPNTTQVPQPTPVWQCLVGWHLLLYRRSQRETGGWRAATSPLGDKVCQDVYIPCARFTHAQGQYVRKGEGRRNRK